MHAKQQVEIPKLNPPPPFTPPPPTKTTFVSRNTHSQPKPKPVVSSSTPAFRVLNKFCSECGKGPQTRRFCGECGAKNLLDEGQTVNQVHDVKQFSRATNITRSTVNQNPNSFRAAAAPPLKKKVGGWKPKGNVCPSCNKSVFFNEEARAGVCCVCVCVFVFVLSSLRSCVYALVWTNSGQGVAPGLSALQDVQEGTRLLHRQ
jgi:hypothetical protein